MIKIYFGERFVTLTNDKNQTSKHPITHSFTDVCKLKTFLGEFCNSNYTSACIFSNDEQQLFKDFSSLYVNIDAAGGLIENANNEVLIIDRRGYIDLPKGKREPNETHEQNALREVSEETGMTSACIVSHITNTYHTYPLGDKTALKCTYWYKMQVDGCPQPTPQTEEDILTAQWISKSELNKLAEKTYASLKEVFLTAK